MAYHIPIIFAFTFYRCWSHVSLENVNPWFVHLIAPCKAFLLVLSPLLFQMLSGLFISKSPKERFNTTYFSLLNLFQVFFFLSILFLSTISETREKRTFWQAYYMSHSELGHRWHLAKTLLTTLQISTHWFLVMTLDYWLTIRYSLFPATPRSCLSIPSKVTLKPDISCGHFFLAMKSILLDKKISPEHLWFISQDKVSLTFLLPRLIQFCLCHAKLKTSWPHMHERKEDLYPLMEAEIPGDIWNNINPQDPTSFGFQKVPKYQVQLEAKLWMQGFCLFVLVGNTSQLYHSTVVPFWLVNTELLFR